MGRTKRTRPEPRPGFLTCTVCRQDLPREVFPTITVRDKRCRSGHTWTGPAWECRECRKQQRREWRRRKAAAAGKAFLPHGDRRAWEASQKNKREKQALEARQQRQQRNDVRRQTIESDERRCSNCGLSKRRDGFHPSMLDRNSTYAMCRSCFSEVDAAKFQANKDALSDAYVRRQITKQTGLAARLIPQSMIEAKRVQLMIDRALPSSPELYARWIRQALSSGPMDAEKLNQMAKVAGFIPNQLRRERRQAGAVYDRATNTWRIA